MDKSTKFKSGSFASTQPPRLVIAIAAELGITDYSSIVNWELELFDTQPAQLGGLSKELLFAPRIDDKLCSFSALEALIVATSAKDFLAGSAISLVGLFDDEEIGSRLRQGAAGNLMSSIIERTIDSFSNGKAGAVSFFNLGEFYFVACLLVVEHSFPNIRQQFYNLGGRHACREPQCKTVPFLPV